MLDVPASPTRCIQVNFYFEFPGKGDAPGSRRAQLQCVTSGVGHSHAFVSWFEAPCHVANWSGRNQGRELKTTTMIRSQLPQHHIAVPAVPSALESTMKRSSLDSGATLAFRFISLGAVPFPITVLRLSFPSLMRSPRLGRIRDSLLSKRKYSLSSSPWYIKRAWWKCPDQSFVSNVASININKF